MCGDVVPAVQAYSLLGEQEREALASGPDWGVWDSFLEEVTFEMSESTKQGRGSKLSAEKAAGGKARGCLGRV